MYPAPPRTRHLTVLLPVLAALTALAVLPLWVAEWLPLLDLPPYLHAVTVWMSAPLHGPYALAYEWLTIPVPTWLSLGGVRLLSVFGGAETGARLLLTLALISVPLAGLALVRSARHSGWVVVGMLPWLLGADLVAGRLPQVVALPVALGVLAAHLSWLRHTTPLRAAILAWLLALLALSHWLPWLVFVALLPVLAAWEGARVGGWRKAVAWPLRDLVIALPSIGLMLPWMVSVLRHPASGSLYKARHALPLENLDQLADRLFDHLAPRSEVLNGFGDLLLGRPGDLASGLWLLALTLWALGAARQPRSVANPGHINGTAYLGRALGLLFAAYFGLPRDLWSPLPLGEANAVLIPLLGVLAVAALPVRPDDAPPTARVRVWIGTLLMGTVAVVVPMATLHAFALASTEVEPMRQALAVVPKGKSVLTLRTQPDSAFVRGAPWSAVGDYAAVLRKGYAPATFAGDPTLPVRPRPSRIRPAPPPDQPDSFTWQDHGRFYDYVAVLRDPSTQPPLFEVWLRAMTRVYQRGPWQVYRNDDVVKFPPPPDPPRPPPQVPPRALQAPQTAPALAPLPPTPSPLTPRPLPRPAALPVVEQAAAPIFPRLDPVRVPRLAPPLRPPPPRGP
ncbi:MAG: hypothetical protein ACOYOB_11595 [Myxococcota bacterium]